MNQFRDFYDWLNNIAESCAETIDYECFSQKKNMFIISVIEEARLKTFLAGLLEVNPGIQLTILVQDYVVDGFIKNFGKVGKILGWKGGYTTQIADLFNNKKFDSFVFFSDFPINLRDQNFFEIAEGLDKGHDIDTYCCTIGNDIYHYNNVQMYRQALRVYEDVSILIENYLQQHV